VTDPVMWLTWS